MEHFWGLVQSVVILLTLILLTFYLKKRDVIRDENNQVFSRLVTDFALPALIFSTLAQNRFDSGKLTGPMVMLGSIVVSMLIGWALGRLLKLEDKKLGVFIVLTGFGSSSTLGYPLIKQMFGDNPEALSDALIIGELGACLPFFVLGVAILMYFGRKGGEQGPGMGTTLVPFLRSPIFIAMAAGIVLSFAPIPMENPVVALAFRVLEIIGASLMIFVALSIGLMLKPVKIRSIAGVVMAVVVVKMVFEPLLSLGGAHLLNIDALETEILMIEAAMPSGALAAVIANRYGGDGAFASILVLATYFIGLVSVPIMFLLSVY